MELSRAPKHELMEILEGLTYAKENFAGNSEAEPVYKPFLA
jgi:hypothetical protein